MRLAPSAHRLSISIRLAPGVCAAERDRCRRQGPGLDHEMAGTFNCPVYPGANSPYANEAAELAGRQVGAQALDEPITPATMEFDNILESDRVERMIKERASARRQDLIDDLKDAGLADAGQRWILAMLAGAAPSRKHFSVLSATLPAFPTWSKVSTTASANKSSVPASQAHAFTEADISDRAWLIELFCGAPHCTVGHIGRNAAGMTAPIFASERDDYAISWGRNPA